VVQSLPSVATDLDKVFLACLILASAMFALAVHTEPTDIFQALTFYMKISKKDAPYLDT